MFLFSVSNVLYYQSAGTCQSSDKKMTIRELFVTPTSRRPHEQNAALMGDLLCLIGVPDVIENKWSG